jgi:hypothetical protein
MTVLLIKQSRCLLLQLFCKQGSSPAFPQVIRSFSLRPGQAASTRPLRYVSSPAWLAGAEAMACTCAGLCDLLLTTCSSVDMPSTAACMAVICSRSSDLSARVLRNANAALRWT